MRPKRIELDRAELLPPSNVISIKDHTMFVLLVSNGDLLGSGDFPATPPSYSPASGSAPPPSCCLLRRDMPSPSPAGNGGGELGVRHPERLLRPRSLRLLRAKGAIFGARLVVLGSSAASNVFVWVDCAGTAEFDIVD